MQTKNAKKEREYKFAPAANRQFKFTTLEPASTVARRAKTIFRILGLKTADGGEYEIRDTYLDTEEGTLADHGVSLRLRQLKGGQKLTIKRNDEAATTGEHLERLEDEFKVSRELNIRSIPSELIRRRLKKNFGMTIDLGKLVPTVSIVNRRYVIHFDTEVRGNEFCYDKFYSVDQQTLTYGHFSSEIEFEVKAKNPKQDVRLQEVIEAFREIFQLEPNHRSKLSRSLEQLRSPEVKTVHTLGLDVVGYSTRTSDIQSQIIQCLNKYAKDAIRKHRGNGSHVHEIYIPTGDGMFIVFEDRPETIIPIVLELQKTVKAWCRSVAYRCRFAFRASLHSGPVFKYSDINENLNYAGNGINFAARLLQMGEAWSVVASKEAFEVMGRTSDRYASRFKEIGDRRFKHGERINVWNFFDPESKVGRA